MHILQEPKVLLQLYLSKGKLFFLNSRINLCALKEQSYEGLRTTVSCSLAVLCPANNLHTDFQGLSPRAQSRVVLQWNCLGNMPETLLWVACGIHVE